MTIHSSARPADAPTRPADPAAWSASIETLLGVPPTQDNEVTVLRNGDEIFPAMLDAIEAAEQTVDMVTFVYWTGDIARRVAAALADAARRGVRVRTLLDAVGARLMPDELVDEMTAAGVDVRWFRPLDDVAAIGDANHRTHRKLLVCDGRVGFTGGVGIAEEWTGDARDETEWRDTHIRVRGRAVRGLTAAFIDNWADTADGALDASTEPSDPDPDPGSSSCFVLRGAAEVGASDLRRLLRALIQLSSERVRIASAYFNPDDEIVADLCAAARRGVTVQLLLPGEHADKRFVQLNGEGDYQSLLDEGVEIWTYETSMMHAKVVTVDGIVASIGSANLNERSMQHDEECNLVVVDDDPVRVLDRHFDDDLTESVRLDPGRWARRSVVQRVGERLTGLVRRWL